MSLELCIIFYSHQLVITFMFGSILMHGGGHALKPCLQLHINKFCNPPPTTYDIFSLIK